MKIFVKNETEKEMLHDFMVHVKHDLESVMDLYEFDDEARKEICEVTDGVGFLIRGIDTNAGIHCDIKNIVDNLMLRGMTDKEISEITGLSELTVKRCRMRVKQ